MNAHHTIDEAVIWESVRSRCKYRSVVRRIAPCNVTTKFQISREVACETSQAAVEGASGLTRATTGQRSETKGCERVAKGRKASERE